MEHIINKESSFSFEEIDRVVSLCNGTDLSYPFSVWSKLEDQDTPAFIFTKHMDK